MELEQRVQDGLAKGRFVLLIVGDRICPAATQLAQVIQSAPHLQSTLAEFAASLPAELADLFRSYIQSWDEKGYTIYWGKVGFSLRVFHEGKLRTVMDAYPDNMSICQESRLERYGLPREGYSEYRSALLGSPRIAAALTTGRHYVKYDELTTDEVRLLLEATDSMVGSD